MPLDPSIIGRGAQSTPIASPFEALQTVAQFQAIRDQTEARRLAADAARQKAADEAAIRTILTDTGGDIDLALPRLRTIAPKAALEYETEIAKQRKETFEGLKATHDFSGKQLDVGIKLLQGVTDQKTYDLVRPMIGTMAPDIAQAMGDQYDPARVQQFLNVGLTQKDIYERKNDALKLLTEGKAMEGVGTWLATINPKDPNAATLWDQAKAGAKTLGVPDAILAQFGDYSPANVARAGQLTITPTKQAELAGQAATRAQTQAHQAVEEQISRGNLDVARGHLAVSRAAETRQAATGGAATGGVKLTAAQQEDIATMLTVEQLAQEVQAIDTKAGELPGVGPLAGRFGASLRGSGGATGETLRNTIGNIQGTIAKLRGGTSFTPSEQALLDTYTPTTTDTDAAIRTKLTTLVDFIQKKRTNTLRVAAGQYTLPADAETGGNRVTAPNGKTYTFHSAAEAAAFKKRAGIP